MNHLIKHIIVIWVFALGCESLNAQSYFEKGENYYAKRSEGAIGVTAPKTNINKAIANYKKSKKSPESVAGLMKAYEFKGSYTQLTEKKRVQTYKKAMALGLKNIKKYPDNVAIRYYYLTNLGRWGTTIGVMKAAKEGVADKIKDTAEEIIIMDPAFGESGAQRILGIVHLNVPSIPFVIGWPSDEKALELLQSAYEGTPENPANARFYAEALMKNEEMEKAYEILEKASQQKPRAHKILEDQDNLDAINEMINKYGS